MWVLPTPGGPSRAMLVRASTNSSVARSLIRRGSRSGWNAWSNSARVLWWGRPLSFRAPAEPALLAQPGLLAEDEVQEVEVAELAGLRSGDEVAGVLWQVRQAQPLCCVADACAGELAHRGPCVPVAVAASSPAAVA